MSKERIISMIGMTMGIICLFAAPAIGKVHFPIGLLLLLASPICIGLSASIWASEKRNHLS